MMSRKQRVILSHADNASLSDLEDFPRATLSLIRALSRELRRVIREAEPELTSSHHNPILDNYRDCKRQELSFTHPGTWRANLLDPQPGAWSYATQKQREHAIKVFERLMWLERQK